MRLPGEGLYIFGRPEVDIADHIDEHEEVLRKLAFRYGRYDVDLREDCYQAGVLALIKAHNRWTYHGAKLLTYAWHDVRKAMLKQVKLVKTEYRYGITEELDDLQEIAERQGRDRLYLDRLYDEPIEGLKPPVESTLTEDEEELAQKIRANLSRDELTIVEASVDRSLRDAAAFLGMAPTTYGRRLAKVQAKAKDLAQGLLRT
jgi:RNA polymerase sigma factor (sigma-70 family)